MKELVLKKLDKKDEIVDFIQVYAVHPIFKDYLDRYKERKSIIPIIDAHSKSLGYPYKHSSIVDGTYKLYKWFNNPTKNKLKAILLENIFVAHDPTEGHYDPNTDEWELEYQFTEFDNIFYATDTDGQIYEFHLPVLDNINQFISIVKKYYINSSILDSLTNIVRTYIPAYICKKNHIIDYEVILDFNKPTKAHIITYEYGQFGGRIKSPKILTSNIYKILKEIDDTMTSKDVPEYQKWVYLEHHKFIIHNNNF